MNKVPLDIYDDMPKGMKKYIQSFGWHFNKNAYEYAVSLMKKNDSKTGEKKAIKGFTKEEIDSILTKYGITLKNRCMHDYVFAATMCRADYYGSSIEDELHLALYVKDTVDDVDASNETTFRRWVATMVGNGEPIDWDEIC